MFLRLFRQDYRTDDVSDKPRARASEQHSDNAYNVWVNVEIFAYAAADSAENAVVSEPV